MFQFDIVIRKVTRSCELIHDELIARFPVLGLWNALHVCQHSCLSWQLICSQKHILGETVINWLNYWLSSYSMWQSLSFSRNTQICVLTQLTIVYEWKPIISSIQVLKLINRNLMHIHHITKLYCFILAATQFRTAKWKEIFFFDRCVTHFKGPSLLKWGNYSSVITASCPKEIQIQDPDDLDCSLWTHPDNLPKI